MDHLSPQDRAEVEAWDWAAIARADAKARARMAAQPPCPICGRPMCCGQDTAHVTCDGSAA